MEAAPGITVVLSKVSAPKVLTTGKAGLVFYALIKTLS